MATTEQPSAAQADPMNPVPSNQENQDPDDPGLLRNMFYEGVNKIGTHKTENLFEALEKRNLTEEEQAVIDERVAHQRKMFELFERREKQRKVRELREVCPDISEEEAQAALDMCNGREDEAAASLVSDPNFKRKVKAACGTGPPIARQGSGNGGSGSGRSRNWHARPTGPRPKLIDPATLGDSVFVGAFRGKGFQGVSKGVKAAGNSRRRSRGNATTGAAVGGASGSSEPETDAEPETITDTDEMDEDTLPQRAPDASEDAEAEEEREGTPDEQEDHEEEKKADQGKSTPPTVPKQYALVRETSQGEVRAVTDSEIKKASQALRSQGRSASPTTAAAAAVDDGEPLPTRASARRSTAVNVSMLEKMSIKLADMEDGTAAAWLAKMAPEMASNVLQTFGSEDPVRAITLQEMMESVKTKTSAEKEADGVAAPASARKRTPRSASKRAAEDDSDAGWDSEDTITDTDEPAAAPASAGGRSNRPRRAAAAAKKSLESESEEDEAAQKRSARKARQASASKRRKSSLEVEEKAAAAAAVAAVAAETAAAAQSGPLAMDVDPAQQQSEQPQQQQEDSAPSAAASGRRSNSRGIAISARGHTNRGRVKQKSHKSADLVEVGTLNLKAGWHNAGYIFPEGFHSRTLFRSSVALDQLCVHECHIIGKGGQYWPSPTFKVVALDRPEEPLIAKSCTGCWTGVLKRINAEIEARRKAGEDLPPPPKTAIAGPEYFGLNQPNIQEAIEELDTDQLCEQYWAGKQERQRAAAGLPTARSDGGGAARPPRPPRSAVAPRRGGGGGRRRRGSGSDSDTGGVGSDGEDEAQYMTNRWSSVSRTDRYRKRLADNGEDTTALDVDADNPVPDIIDPITLEPVIRPAISPYGHVMGAATWKAVLAENGTCPFTKQPLRWEQCRILTVHNIEAYRDKIIR